MDAWLKDLSWEELEGLVTEHDMKEEGVEMARSLKGNLRGSAARIANAEFREVIGGSRDYSAYNRNRDDFVSLRDELFAVDPNAQSWWEKSGLMNVLYFGSDAKMAYLLKVMAKRLAKIYAGEFARQVYHAAMVTNSKGRGI